MIAITIAISLKVNDGLVLAADSATTISQGSPQGGVINVYDNANKVFNLHKGLPIGAITWGAGSIGNSSISALVKDFRKEITYSEEHKIDPESYTIEEMAIKFYNFIYTDLYIEKYKGWKNEDMPNLGFVIGGYSCNQPHAEEWRINILNGQCDGPELLRGLHDSGANWNGQPEAISRLVNGFDPRLINILKAADLKADKIDEIIKLASEHLTAPIIIPPMPIQDAIDIARFLIDLTAKN